MRMHRRGVALLLATAMALGGVATMAQDETAPSPEATDLPPLTPSGRPDLYLDMPYVIGGYEPQISMTRGEEHFASLAPDDPARSQLEQMLVTLEAGPEDLVSGYALVSVDDLFAFVVALRVDGVTPGALAPAYLPILADGLIDPSSLETELGGKDVTMISSVGADDARAELYVYDEGDTVWMIQAPADVAERTLASLPAPMDQPADD